MKRTVLGATMAVVLVAAVLTVSGALIATRKFSNTGSVSAVGVSVWFDSSCTNATSAIAWGTVNPGASENVTV